MKPFLALLLCCLVLTLAAGCVDTRYHLTVNRDGSGDIDLKIAFTDLALRLLGETGTDPLATLTSDLMLDGYNITAFREGGKTGIIAKKHLDRISQQNLDLGALQVVQTASASTAKDGGFHVQRGFFKTRYIVEAQVDPGGFTGISQLGGLDSYLLNQLNFEFVLTLPIRPDNHNAYAIHDDGRTMVWKLVPGQKNRLMVEASHWNPVGLGATALGAIAGLGLVIIFVMRKSKQQKPR
jgi:hypothetical protein